MSTQVIINENRPKFKKNVIPPDIQDPREISEFYKVVFETEIGKTDEQRLADYIWARDKLIVWSLRRPVNEVDVTKSIISAKIRGFQFKLGRCDGVDLHEQCNMALVSFINLLSEETVLNADNPNERRTLRDIARSANLPPWLAYYRNMICHRLVGNPSLDILEPYMDKFLDYMSRHYWSRVVKQELFDSKLCLSHVVRIARFNEKANSNISDPETRRKRKNLIVKRTKRLTRMISDHRRDTVNVIVDFLSKFTPRALNRNLPALIKIILMTSSFECFIDLLLSRVESNTCTDSRRNHSLMWLSKMIGVIGCEKEENKIKALKKLGLKPKINLYTNATLSPLKCVYLAHRLTRLDISIVKRLLEKMRRKLAHIMGRKQACILIELTRLAQRRKKMSKKSKFIRRNF